MPVKSRLVIDALVDLLDTISGNVPVGISVAPATADKTVGYLIVDPMTTLLTGSLTDDLPHSDQAVHVKAVADDPLKVANLLDAARDLLDSTRPTISGVTVTRVSFELSTQITRDDDEGTVPLFWQADRWRIRTV